MNFLEKIVERKRGAIAPLVEPAKQEALKGEALARRTGPVSRRLRRALLREDSDLNIIAEFKRNSPSRGVIRAGARPAEIALEYEESGASAISVLTEEEFFDGSLDDLKAVRAATALPILRKDFIIHPSQIYEAAAAGTDAILLIVAILSREQLVDWRRLAEDALGLDALVEVHTGAELDVALAAGATMIGVNNRDLATFDVSLATSEELIERIPDEVVAISESGLSSYEEMERLRAAGFDGFLIGESLMRAESPGHALRGVIRDPKEELFIE